MRTVRFKEFEPHDIRALPNYTIVEASRTTAARPRKSKKRYAARRAAPSPPSFRTRRNLPPSRNPGSRDSPTPRSTPIVFQVLPHTLRLGPEVWRVLARCHEIRNRGEYEGDMYADERLVTDLVKACKTVADALEKIAPL